MAARRFFFPNRAPNLKVISYIYVYIHINIYIYICGDRGGTGVKVLYYKSDGRWFDPSLCH